MNRPSTAREALIVEALGEVAGLLERVESLRSSLDAGRLALVRANAAFGERLKAFETGMASVTQQAQARAAEQISRRAAVAAQLSIEVQTRAMNEAARVAFTGQVDSTLARLSASLQLLLQRLDRPWDLWWTHAATAVASATLTWVLMTSFAFK